jgi:flagellar hook protein FlgE
VKGGPIAVKFDLGFDPDVAAKTGLTEGTFLAEGGNPLTGTVTGEIDTKTIKGTGTKFLSELLPGDAVVMGGSSFTVASIQSDTQLTVTKKIDSDEFNVKAIVQSASFSNQIKFFDSLGAEHLVNLRFRKTATNTWEWNAVVDRKDNQNGAFDEVQATGNLAFTPLGQLDLAKTIAATFPTGGFDFRGGASPDQQIKFDFEGTTERLKSGTTQFGSPTLSLLLEQHQDGFSSGSLQSITVDKDGFINGLYTNGQSQSLYQLAIAKFPNQEGLTRVGKNLYMASHLSGEAINAGAGSGGRGEIIANALERSTVDLAEQFVKLITYQRGFQANSKVIITADEVVQELVNLKR